MGICPHPAGSGRLQPRSPSETHAPIELGWRDVSLVDLEQYIPFKVRRCKCVERFGGDRELLRAREQVLKLLEIARLNNNPKCVGGDMYASASDCITSEGGELLAQARLVLRVNAPPARLKFLDARVDPKKMG
jgi:hypothetical protein